MIRFLHQGVASGPVLHLDEPLSFWGAFDPRQGLIIDVHHPQVGQSVQGKVLMMQQSRGSGSASGGLAEALRRGTGPCAIILVKPDVNLAVGAQVAETIYGKSCPVLVISPQEFAAHSSATYLYITPDGLEVAP